MLQRGYLRDSLRYSLWDGLFTALMLGVSEYYLVPFAVALGATALQTSLIATLPLLAASFAQTFSASTLSPSVSRLRLILFCVFFHALLWIPMAVLPHVTGSVNPVVRVWVYVMILILFQIFGAFSVPAWQSLMSDHIPLKKRGRYFGWRNRLQGVLTVSFCAFAGVVLHLFDKNGVLFWGYTLIFIMAFVFRGFAWLCLRKMHEPRKQVLMDKPQSMGETLQIITRSRFGAFVLFACAMAFAVNLSSALLAVFILKDLSYSYAAYMMIVATAALSGFVFQGLFGVFGDLDGNVRVLRVAGYGVAMLPAFWLVSQNLVFLFFLQIAAGAFWGGYTLLTQNYLIESLPAKSRIRYISYFNFLQSASAVGGAVIGGLLFHRMPNYFGYSYLTLFLLSCLCRTAVMAFLHKRIHEVRGAQLSL